MVLKKAIALGVLAAVIGAPSALARVAPPEVGNPLPTLHGRVVGNQPKLKPHKQCVQFGPYCFSHGY